jgi:hypothetical protein
VQRRLERLPADERPAGELALADVQRFVATSSGFSSWNELVQTLSGAADTPVTHATMVTIPQQSEDPASGMLRPVELRITLPMELPGGEYTTTENVWQMLVASKTGNLDAARHFVATTPGLVRCAHNYMPPLHLAIREGCVDVVRFLLEQGAYDANYVTYPYNETFFVLAEDRSHWTILTLLREYATRPEPEQAGGRHVHGVGHIDFPSDADRITLEKLINVDAVHAVAELLDARPDLVHDELIFCAEGILSMVANRKRQKMLNLLLARGARVPDMAKWGRFYYFKHADIGALLLERGMNPNHMTWHRTTLLHDMAGEGNMEKATLLLKHGADINPVDDEFRTTPLGFAARWGRRDVIRLLLDHGADANTAGAEWATPLAWAEKRGRAEIARDLRAAGAR